MSFVKFPEVQPLRRAGGRRYYRPEDVVILKNIQHLLHEEGYTIKGVQALIKREGVKALKNVDGLKASSTETTKNETLDSSSIDKNSEAKKEALINELKSIRALLEG